MVPLLRVSREGCVTPLLEGLLLMTSAVSRNCLICSLVSGVSSAARASNGSMTKARTKRGLTKGRGKPCIEVSSENYSTLYAQCARGDNSNRGSGEKLWFYDKYFFTVPYLQHYSLPTWSF